MTMLTLYELANNYPENIMFDSDYNKELYDCRVYLLHNGEIHKLLLSYDHIFTTKEEAINKMDDTINKYLKELEKKNEN